MTATRISFTVAQLAQLVEGTLEGDGSSAIHAAVPFEEAAAGTITLATDRKCLAQLSQCQASAVLLSPKATVESPIPVIRVEDPLAAVLRIAAVFVPEYPQQPVGVDPRAAVDPTAKIGNNCSIGPLAYVGPGVELGDDCVLHPHAVVHAGCKLAAGVTIHSHAVLYDRTLVGARSIIHSGAVIGCDGFGYQFRDGRHQKVPQIGTVEIGADVEVGANTSIDRATFGTTRIGDGTKIDNLVMIGHNNQIGRHNIVVSQVGMAGSCTTGDYVVLAGQVGIADHVNIGKGATVGAGAGIFTDVPAGESYLGRPGRPERDAKRYHLSLEKIPDMRKTLADLAKRVELVEQQRRAAG